MSMSNAVQRRQSLMILRMAELPALLAASLIRTGNRAGRLLDINNNINTTATSGRDFHLQPWQWLCVRRATKCEDHSTVETMPNAASRATLNFINGTIENYDPAWASPAAPPRRWGLRHRTNLTSASGWRRAATNDCRTLNIVLRHRHTYLYAESGYSIIEQPTALITALAPERERAGHGGVRWRHQHL